MNDLPFIFGYFCSGSSTSIGHRRLFPAVINGDPVFYLLLLGRNQGTISCSEGTQEAILAIPYQTHDVVPAA